MNFGRIEGLHIRNGEPVFDPPPRVIYTLKFGGRNGPRTDVSIEDLASHPKTVAFFEQLSLVNNGIVQCLVIQNGLPEVMHIEHLGQA